MTTTTLEVPDTTALAQTASGIELHANEMKVQNTTGLIEAGEFLRKIKTVRQRLADTFDPTIQAAHHAHKTAIQAKKTHELPLTKAEQIVKDKMSTYTAEQERLRRAEEDRLREKARLEAEERALEEAAQLEAEGETDAADQVLEAPVTAPIVVVPKTVPKVEGVSTRTVWKFRIVNPAAIPLQYMIPNEKAIGTHGRSMGKAACITGVEFYADESVAVRGY